MIGCILKNKSFNVLTAFENEGMIKFLGFRCITSNPEGVKDEFDEEKYYNTLTAFLDNSELLTEESLSDFIYNQLGDFLTFFNEHDSVSSVSFNGGGYDNRLDFFNAVTCLDIEYEEIMDSISFDDFFGSIHVPLDEDFAPSYFGHFTACTIPEYEMLIDVFGENIDFDYVNCVNDFEDILTAFKHFPVIDDSALTKQFLHITEEYLKDKDLYYSLKSKVVKSKKASKKKPNNVLSMFNKKDNGQSPYC